ncbi:tetratricopeptide repeat protein, partial [bacterium]|nr:tetratricopeptide repeat protein [bacterium]
MKKVFSKNSIVYVLFLLSIILGYAHIINGEFVYDDKNFIVTNYPIKTWLFSRPWDFFLKPEVAVWTGIYRPIRTLSFAIDYQLYGLNPIGYHLHNLFLHFINAILLFSLLIRLFKTHRIPFFATLLFIIHPLQTETVTWVSSRADLFFTTGVLGCLLLYMQFAQSDTLRLKTIFMWNAFYFLALLSKETAIALIPTLLLYDIFFSWKKYHVPMRTICKKRWVFYFVSSIVTLSYMFVRFSLFEKVSQKPYWGGTASANFLTMLDATVYYFKLIVFPINLCIDYSTFPITRQLFGNPYMILNFLFYAALLLLLFFRIQKKDYTTLFFTGFFILFLLPTWNIIPISAILAERFLYVPLIGLFAVISSGIVILMSSKSLFQRPILSMVCMLSAFLIAFTAIRNGDWKTDFTLWNSCAVLYPGNFKAHVNLGSDYHEKGESLKAITENYKLITIKPQYPTAYYNLGNIYWSLGLFEQSEKAFFDAIKLKPDYVEAYNNLGTLYIDKQWNDKARAAFLKGLEYDSSHGNLHFNLGSLYFSGYKDYTRAYYHLHEALKSPEFMRSRRLHQMLANIKEQKNIEDRD